MRRRRLQYFSRLARIEFPSLHAALQATTRAGEPLPWVKTIINDLRILRDELPNLLGELPPPDADIAPYWAIARDCPAEWTAIVKKYLRHEDDDKFAAARRQRDRPPGSADHSCSICKRGFASRAQLGRHMYAKHRLKSDVRKYVGDISQCPICHADFQSRNRLIMHLMKANVRSRHRPEPCRVTFMKNAPLEVDRDLLQRLEARDVNTNRMARKLGHNQELATRPCRRTTPAVHKGKKVRRHDLSHLTSERSFKRTFPHTSLRGAQTARPAKKRRLPPDIN